MDYIESYFPKNPEEIADIIAETDDCRSRLKGEIRNYFGKLKRPEADPLNILRAVVELDGLRKFRTTFGQVLAIRTMESGANVIIRASRQCGKTTMLISYGISKALRSSNTTVHLFSDVVATSSLGVYVYPLKPYLGHIGCTEQRGALHFGNDSSIYVHRTSRNYRGIGGDIYLFDEMAFYNMDYTVLNAIRSGGQVVVCSTPHLKRGLFYNLWTRAEEKQDGSLTPITIPWHMYHSPLDIMRHKQGEYFENEFECKFL